MEKKYEPKRNNKVQVRFGKGELEKVRKKADRLGMTLSSYLRALGICSDIKSIDD